MNNENGLVISHLNKHYGKNQVLKNINLNLDSGKIIGLCGPNGAGKTTLIKTIVGLLRDYHGDIQVCGYPVGSDSKALVSYLPDVEYLAPNLTGLKAARLYSDMYSDFDMGVLEDLFLKMKLDGSMPVSKMSKGMREKFQLALCLSRKARIYIFDEPIAGVDPASRDSIIETILSNYTQDALLIISTHLIQDIEGVLDEVVFIKDGAILMHENCDDLREARGQTIDEIFREEFKW
ncbi:ABC transporter ATP-binding protein [Erysipelothrix rhusiopathiae]|nr:ABC transporter ATP-binding protein [Erysipelothrix rhusiopathiae]MDE8313878.1 ABC transporter ATP-binding protein [Erysipelothrix rhusiopathiae]MDE8328839.1 ABC transporter ATP-binding protein [Erysipelothrix rhusiopathiae]MDE8332177.1 ABC transporter ATP-binding protein [Erysipelothrix rhusiopathiae]